MDALPVLLLGGFAAGLLTLAGVAIRREQEASRHWPEVAGTVVAVEAEPAVGRGTGRGTSEEVWQPLVVYDYEVGGRRYTGDRLELDPAHARMSRSEVDGLLRAYRPGMPVRIRYDPRKPDRAVLVPGDG